VRDLLVSRISKEILGPRDGPFERISGKNGSPPPDPSDEYVVGVLEPQKIERSAIAHFGSAGLFGNQEINRGELKQVLPIAEEDQRHILPLFYIPILY
jgi:hypothetical protein